MPAYSMGPPDSPDFSQQALVPSLSPLQIVSPAMLQVSVPPSPGFSPLIAQSPIIPWMSALPSLEPSAAQLPVSIYYIFLIPQPPPNLPMETKFLSAKGNLTKFQVQSEFLTVETDVASLQHQVQVLQNENGILKNYLLHQEQYREACFQELKHRTMNHQGVSHEVEKEKEEDLDMIASDGEAVKEVEVAELDIKTAVKLNSIANLLKIMFKKFLSVDDLLTREELDGAAIPDGEELLLTAGSKEVRQVQFD
ncbi:hypothetical protein GYMLUDRAFT_236000 [Collybiopsis luxurians FD-317 M1]|nr:hypothetical protein GYMLUDRAFT_236000 [Collybiopsis luxurians FD-317 M1]